MSENSTENPAMMWHHILAEMDTDHASVNFGPVSLGVDNIVSFNPYTQNEITFYNGEGDVSLSINFSTGEVKLSDYMKANEAAMMFWDRMMEMNPYQAQKTRVVDQFELFTVSLVDDYESKYNRAKKVVK